MYYSDGSAFGNPGPSGAGVCIFFSCPDSVIDAGAAAGFSTNNIGELLALRICFLELIKAFPSRGFKQALIFTDSQYAKRAVEVKTAPTSTVNKDLVLAARAALDAARSSFSVHIHWVRGHVAIGGNERVDRVAKHFARASVGSPAVLTPGFFALDYLSCSHDWGPGFPLSSVPLALFTSGIPFASLAPVPL